MNLNKLFKHIRYRIRYARNISLPQWRIARQLPPLVQSGPFKGMQYLEQSVGSVVLPKLIGTYEQELHPVLLSLRSRPYEQCIDIGAAEGYYAVGLAKYILTPVCTSMLAYEQNPKGRRLIRQLAMKNKIDGIQIRGYCSSSELALALGKSYTFLLMDVEGGEQSLLDPLLADFSRTDILVELHPHMAPGIEATLKHRFSATHHIETIELQPRVFPGEVQLPEQLLDKKDYLMKEFRTQQNWLWMQSRLANPV